MAINLKKIALFTSIISAFSILAIETIPSNTVATTNAVLDADHPGQIISSKQNLLTLVASGYSNQKKIKAHDATANVVESETDQEIVINQCTLTAIQNSSIDKEAQRKLGSFVKAFDKKGMKKLVKLGRKVQRVLYSEKGREQYYEFHDFVAGLYQEKRILFCNSDPITRYLQFVERVVEHRNSLEFEDIDLIISSNIELIRNFGILEYFILIFSVDVKFGEEITLALIQKLNVNLRLQHQPLSMYSGIYWMLFHSFNTLSDKSEEVVWRNKQLNFVIDRFENVKELPEKRKARKRLIVFMTVASYQFNPKQFSVGHFFDKYRDQTLSIEKQTQSLTELANIWLDAVMPINNRWLEKHQINEILLQFVDYAGNFSSIGEQTQNRRMADKQIQEDLLWLIAERGQSNNQSAILLAIELLKRRDPDSERLSRYMLKYTEQLGQDEQFLEQIDRLISLYPEDYALNTRRYNYQKNAELLSLNDINQYLLFLSSKKGVEDQEMDELLTRQELSLLQERADYYLNSEQYDLAEIDRVQIYEQSPDLDNLTELGEVYNLNNKPENFIALFESQISLLGVHPDELNNSFIEQDYQNDIVGFLLTVYSVYADSLERVGDSEGAVYVRGVIKKINGGLN